jgi:hypothetical protein
MNLISKFFQLLFFFLCSELSAQVAPFVDYSGYLNTFYKGNVRTLEFQRINSFQAGDNVVAYVDNRENFKIFNGEKVESISVQLVQSQVSDNIVAWQIGNFLYGYENGVKKTLCTNTGQFVVKDSMIVYQDTRFKTINVWYKNEVFQIMQQTGDMTMPEAIGENIIGFKDNGDVYRVFWRGKLFEIGGSSYVMDMVAGTDVISFNNTINKTFSVFENGDFYDVETAYMKKYKSGRGFVIYEDQIGNLWKFQQGNKINVTDFNSGVWEVLDDVFVWNENNLLFTFVNDVKTQIINYLPSDYQLKNSQFVYRNNLGGISVFYQGKNTVLTNQTESKYAVYGNTVLVELFNKSYLYFSNGEIFHN